MANFEKVYSIGFNAKKALKSLTAFEKRFAKLDKRLLKIAESFSKFNLAISQNQGAAVAAIGRLDDSLKTVGKRSTQTGKKLQKLLGVQARKPINKTSKAITAMGRKGMLATQRIEKGARGAARGLSMMGAGAKRAKQSMTGLITKISLFIGAAQGIRSVVSNFMDFDRSMTLAGAKFSAINRDMAPGTEAFAKFRKEIRAAAVDTEHTASAVAGAVDFWAKAGKTAEQTKAVIPVTLDFASANTDASGAALDMARAGDILSDALGQFQLDSADPTVLMANTARVADVMSKAANSANVSAEELFESYKQAGPVLSAVGGDIEETSALLATMANAGLKGSIAGRSLKIATSALNAPSKKQSKLMKELGINVKTAKGDMKSLTNVIGQLDKATKKMGEADRFEAFATIFGREGVTGFLNLVAKGEADIAGLTKSLRDASGETKRLAEITRKSASAQMQQFWNQMTNIGFTIIEETQLFDKLGKKMKSIDWKGVSKFITDTFIPGIMMVAKAISNFVIPVIEVLADTLGGILGPAFDFVSDQFDLINGKGDSFKKKLTDVVLTLKGVARALPGLALSVVQFLSTQFSGFIDMFQRTIWNMQEMFNGFIRGMSREWDSTIGHVSALGGVMLESYGTVFQELKALFHEVVSIFLGGTDDIEEDWYATGDRMGQDIAQTVQFISTVIGTIAPLVAAVFATMIRIVAVVVSEIRQIFTDMFGGILDIAQGDFLTGISRVGVALADAITLPFRTAIAGLIKLVSKIPGAAELASAVGIDLDYMGDIVSGGFSDLVSPDAKGINRSGTIDDDRREGAPVSSYDVAANYKPLGDFSFQPDFVAPEFDQTTFDQSATMDIDTRFGKSEQPDFDIPAEQQSRIVTRQDFEPGSMPDIEPRIGQPTYPDFGKPSVDLTPNILEDQTVGGELQSALDRLDDNINSIRQEPDVPLSPILTDQLKNQEKMDMKTEKFQQKMLEATQRQAKAKPAQVNVTVEGSKFTINADGANAQDVGRIVRREIANNQRRQEDGFEQATRRITFGEQ